MSMAEVPLSVALGRTTRTEALFDGGVADPALPLDLPAIPVISRAFAPMVREGRYEVSEMAIATFLMAKEAATRMRLKAGELGLDIYNMRDALAKKGLRYVDG